MSVSLFRRWRSQKFSDLVGQASVVSTLQNVLQAGDPARAYLFCGPRGTGKTSSARIFAKALNCENGPCAEPCDECSQCRSIAEGSNLDVFEIDAASHTQVDKIRDFIVEKVHFTPVAARFKVYIIDEVHKLSTSSFNALLKTLEEPPSHVVFILATTHPHEMPATILSRCQRYDFRPLTAGETENHLKMIADVENIEMDEEAARQLARGADGSLRDALVLFEQASVFAEGQLTREKVLDLLGGVGYEVLEEMLTDLHKGEAASALSRLDGWISRGRDLKRLAESLQEHLRMLLLIRVKSEDQSIQHLSQDERASLDRLAGLLSVSSITQWLRATGELLSEIRHGRRARLEWELFLVGLAHPESDPSLEGLQRRLERVEQGVKPGESSSAAPASSGLDAAMVARIEALESASPSPSEPDQGLLERIQKLEDKLEQSASEPATLDSKTILAALAGAGLDTSVLKAEKTKSPEEPTAPAPQDEDTIKAAPEQKSRPQRTSKVPISNAGNLERDIVDDWLEIPEILVTKALADKDQTPSSASEARESAPASEPLPEPEVEAESAPEPVRAVAEDLDTPELELEPEAEIEVDPPVEGQPEPKPEEVVEEVIPEQVSQETPEVVEAPEEPADTPPPNAKVAVPDSGDAFLNIENKDMELPSVEKDEKPSSIPDEKEFFRLLMQKVKEKDIRLHAVLADARLTHLSAESFELAVPPGYDWHFGKIQEGKALLESVANGFIPGGNASLECSIGGEKAAPPKESEHEELVKRASGVFGGSSILD